MNMLILLYILSFVKPVSWNRCFSTLTKSVVGGKLHAVKFLRCKAIL